MNVKTETSESFARETFQQSKDELVEVEVEEEIEIKEENVYNQHDQMIHKHEIDVYEKLMDIKHKSYISKPHITYQCCNCDKTFSHKRNHLRHLRTHIGDKPYQCTYCEKAFSRNCHLIRHMNMHTGDKPYQCSNCEKVFTSNSNLMNHLRSHTGDR
ncbi:unnamed protein product, partial [Meganyctiphanes norvegica]